MKSTDKGKPGCGRVPTNGIRKALESGMEEGDASEYGE